MVVIQCGMQHQAAEDEIQCQKYEIFYIPLAQDITPITVMTQIKFCILTHILLQLDQIARHLAWKW